MSAVPQKMSIATACRLLRCANRKQLAERLGAEWGTVNYWNKSRGGMLPSLWRDRVELMLLKERGGNPEVVLLRSVAP